MNIETIPLVEIIPYEKNPRKNDKAVDVVAKSIKEFGFKVPIILDKNNVIVAGHTRLKAAQKLGMTEAPVIWADDLTDEQVKAFRIMDNKTHEYGKWDFKLLEEEMSSLKEEGIDLTMTGFTDGELSRLDFSQRKNLNIIPKEVKYEVKRGEVYSLGDHRLICGSCTDEEDFNKLMPNEQATIIWTDPPYNISYKPTKANSQGDAYSEGRFGHKKVFSDNMSDAEYKEFLSKSLRNCYLKSKEKSTLFLWNGDKNLHIAIQSSIDNNWKLNQIGAWVKNSIVFTPGCVFHKILEYCAICFKDGHRPELNEQYVKNQENLFSFNYRSFKDMVNTIDAWYVERDKTKEYNHPTQKPVELAYPAIFACTKQGDIVLDCWGGSGTALIACEMNKRKARIIELDPYYCSVIIERWENLTGKKAEKIQ